MTKLKNILYMSFAFAVAVFVALTLVSWDKTERVYAASMDPDSIDSLDNT